MRSTKLFSFIIVILMLTVVFAGLTPLSAGAGNASKTTAVTSPTARVGNVTTAAVKTPPVVGAGKWNIQTVDSGAVGEYTSLALTSTGSPAISYYDWWNKALKYTYKDASGWHTQVADSTGDVGNYGTSLQLTPTGWPAISYYDYTNGDLKYTYKNAGGWHTQVVDSSGGVGEYNSLQLTPTGWPAISYYDGTNADLKYAYKDAGGWHTQTVDSGGTPVYGAYTSLQLTPTGWPAISYWLQSYGALKYAYKDAGGWHTQVVDSSYGGWPSVGEYPSLALTPAGWPAISYYAAFPNGGDGLKYAYKDAGGWHTQVVDSGYGVSGNVGQYTSLQLTPTGWPAISYFDVTNQDLKYAYKSAS